jgi:hypothetical protein
MAMAARAHKSELRGHDRPRVAPPMPARSDWKGFHADAESMGITLMPWQDNAARYITATGAGRYTDSLGIQRARRLYAEVAVVVARQQGKTTLLKPHIVRSLRAGRKMTHIAQDRELPREMFGLVADTIAETDEDLLPRRRGKIIWPRYGSGQEEIVLTNGGRYRIAAARTGGARGHPNDDLLIDETRELLSMDVINAAEPSLKMSLDPQIVYLSNAGHDGSVVLNSVRARAGEDPALAYLEWSAAPDRQADDRAGWAEANPALGYFPQVLVSLEKDYRKAVLSGNLAGFETENLCRWVATMRERLVDEYAWKLCAADAPLGTPRQPFMAVSVAPGGERVSAAIAWPLPDDFMGLRLLYDVPGPIESMDALGNDMRQTALRLGVRVVAGDPLTDAVLGRFFRKFEPVSGAKFANATDAFVTRIKAGRLRWDDAAQIADDLVWTARKPHEESGSYQAVRANDDRPITAALAAIRAVGLASGPQVTNIARIY